MQEKPVGSGIESAPDLDRLAQRVNEICRSATLDLAFKIGKIIIQELFADSTRMWERGGGRTHSYRALASRGDLALSASALCRAVSVYVLVEQLGGRERFCHLGTSHFQEVLALPPATKEALLLEAEEGRWTVSRLRAEAEPFRVMRAGGSADLCARSLQRLATQLASSRERFGQLASATLPSESLSRVREAAQSLRSELDEFEALLEGSREARPLYESDIRELAGRSEEQPQVDQK
jgi:hypothetical protein